MEDKIMYDLVVNVLSNVKSEKQKLQAEFDSLEATRKEIVANLTNMQESFKTLDASEKTVQALMTAYQEKVAAAEKAKAAEQAQDEVTTSEEGE